MAAIIRVETLATTQALQSIAAQGLVGELRTTGLLLPCTGSPDPEPGRVRHLDAATYRSVVLRHGFFGMGVGAVYRRRRLVEAGGFDPGLSSYQDAYMRQWLGLRHGMVMIGDKLAIFVAV